jgi:Mrp family chromosome partitioning ATPase
VPLAEQLQVARPGGLLEELRTASEIVVLSVPPVLAGPDAQALAPLLDGVLLAVALGTPTRGAREAVHRLRRAHARLLGVVVLRAEPAGESRPRDFASVPLEGGQRHRQSSKPTGHEAGARTRAP